MRRTKNNIIIPIIIVFGCTIIALVVFGLSFTVTKERIKERLEEKNKQMLIDEIVKCKQENDYLKEFILRNITGYGEEDETEGRKK